jgi:hypothetical protein
MAGYSEQSVRASTLPIGTNPGEFPDYKPLQGRTWLGLTLTEANMRKCGRFVLIAIMLAVAATALSLGNAGRVQAEPADPCHYFGFCDE